MIDFTRPRLVAFRERVAVAVPCVPDDEATRAELFGMRLANVLGVYLNYFGRFIPARPRTVEYAPGFWTGRTFDVDADLADLAGKIRRGDDLGSHLPPSLAKAGYTQKGRGPRWEHQRDMALNAFGLHHLHIRLGKGSDHLAFVSFDRASAMFIMLGDHNSFDDGSLAEAVANYQVQTGREVKNAKPSETAPSPADQMRLARRCIGSFGSADGKLTFGAAPMSNGDGLRTRRYADFIARQVAAIDPMLDDPVQVDALMPAARGTWGPEVDFEWHMQDTDLVLFERHTRTLCPVWNGFC